MKAHLYLLAYKPFNVVTQFSGPNPDETLQVLHCAFPKDVYPVGRLDKDSEGLLLLTNDTRLSHRLLSPRFRHQREYWVQVDGIPPPLALQQLEQGVMLKDGLTRPTQARLIAPPELPPRHPPIRYRAHIPTTWLSLTLTEGRNRQVRRMTAAVGYPTLRLVRWRIENLLLGDLLPGQVRAMTPWEWDVFRHQMGV